MTGTRAVDDWDRHWSAFKQSALINPAQAYRRQLILANLDLNSVPTPRVVDIGSGLGDLLVTLHRQHPTVPKLGIELSREGVEIAAARLPQAHFIQRNLIAGEDDPGEYRGFATHAVCSEVLEHVNDPACLLRKAARYMTDGCRLIVTVPGGPRSAYDLHIGHRRHFTPASLQRVLSEAGFKVEFAVAAGFPFFNLYKLLVIMRGRRLAADAGGEPGLLLKGLSAVFRALFKFNLEKSAFGWQIIAVAILNSPHR